MPLAATKARTAAGGSVESTPRKTTSSCAVAADSAIRSGVSSRHGGHHEPHTLITSVMPRYVASVTVRPSMVVNRKAGAGRPASGPGRPAENAGDANRANASAAVA